MGATSISSLRRGRVGAISVLRDWDLCPDVDMVLRAQGADSVGVRQRQSAAVGIAEQAVTGGMPLLQPVVVSATVPVREFRHEQVRLKQGGCLVGPRIAEHLHAAQSVVVAVCSIGPALDEAVSECFAQDPAMRVALDAFGSAAVNLLASAMCQRVDERAATQGLRTTRSKVRRWTTSHRTRPSWPSISCSSVLRCTTCAPTLRDCRRDWL
jgi:hypothetical protein